MPNCKILYFTPILCACVLLTAGCEQALVSREYEEIVIAPPSDPHDFMRNAPFAARQQASLPPSMQIPDGEEGQEIQKILDASVVRPSLSWETPKGWSEEKGSGMRLVTFRTDKDVIECSVVSLGGVAGGLQSNVTRWMGQINVNVAGEQLSEFLSRQKTVKTKGGFSATVIDLSELSQGQQSPSMIAAIAEFQDKTIFVKMTGNKESVIANRDQLISLIQSLNL